MTNSAEHGKAGGGGQSAGGRLLDPLHRPLTGVSKNTISKLLLALGAACEQYQDAALLNLPCNRLQADEI